MAKVKLSSFLQSVSGRLGKVVFYNRYGREYARVYVKPSNQDTESQRFIRKTFGCAVKAWQELPLPEKEQYNRKAKRLAMSGYNLFISKYMKDNIAPGDTPARIFRASSRYPHSTMKAYSSVASPYFLPDSSVNAEIHAFYCQGAG